MKSLLFYIALILVLISCRSDDDHSHNPIDQLPPVTQTGANTFGCLINGEPFVVTNTSLLTAIYQNNILVLSGSTHNGDKSISFNVYDGVIQGDAYSLTDLNKVNSGYSDFINYPTSYCQYLSEDIIEGYLTINYLNQETFVISGTFEFTASNEDCDNIQITNGRFDLQYIP